MSNVVYLFNPEQPSYLNSADSLAYQAMILDKPVFSQLFKKYGDASSLKQMDFGTNFAVSCAKYTVENMKKSNDLDDELDTFIENFIVAILDLKDIEFSYGISTLYQEILQHFPHLCLKQPNEYTLKAVFSQRISLILLDYVYEDLNKRKTVVETFKSYVIL